MTHYFTRSATLATFTVVTALMALLHSQSALAITNTHAADLERSSSQYFSISDSLQTGLDLSGDATFEFWIKPESISGDLFVINKANPSVPNTAYWIFLSSQNTIEGRFSDDGTINTGHHIRFVTDDPIASVGTWQHVAVVFDISEDDVKVYIDGEEVAVTVTGTMGASVYNSAESVLVGARQHSTVQSHFDGYLDEVRVWNRVRTESEIQDERFDTLSGSESGLVSYWGFNGTSTDKTSNNNDLTPVASPTYSEEPAHQVICTYGQDLAGMIFTSISLILDIDCEVRGLY